VIEVGKPQVVFLNGFQVCAKKLHSKESKSGGWKGGKHGRQTGGRRKYYFRTGGVEISIKKMHQ